MTGRRSRRGAIGRRGFLAAAASGGVALFAGCSGDSDGDGDGPDGDSADTEGDGDGTPDGGDGSDPAATPDSDDDDGTETPADGGGESSSVALSEVLTYADSFAIEAETTTDGQRMTYSGRFAGGNMYLDISQDDQSFEMYVVDGQSYMVSQGQCLIGSSDGVSQEEVDPDSWSATDSGTAVTSTGTTTIDGTEMYVFELTSQQASQSGAATYYVETASGRLRRVEAGDSTWSYHSWGEVDPIQKPEMECQSMPDGGGMGN